MILALLYLDYYKLIVNVYGLITLILKTAKRNYLNTIFASIGNFTTSQYNEEVWFSKRHLFLCFILLTN